MECSDDCHIFAILKQFLVFLSKPKISINLFIVDIFLDGDVMQVNEIFWFLGELAIYERKFASLVGEINLCIKRPYFPS